MYAVFHSAMAFESTRISESILMKGTITQEFETALIFAEVLVSEHADAINVSKNLFGYNYAASGNGSYKTGFVLRTSNGSLVWYTVKSISKGE